MLKKILKMCSKHLPTLEKMHSMIFKPLWIKAKTGERIMCKICNKVWGMMHIDECPLLMNYRYTIQQWRSKGYARLELYINRNEIKHEADQLKEAYTIIEQNSYSRK